MENVKMDQLMSLHFPRIDEKKTNIPQEDKALPSQQPPVCQSSSYLKHLI